MAIKMVKSKNQMYDDAIAVNVESRSINCDVRVRETERGIQQSTIFCGRLVFLNREHQAVTRPDVEAKCLQVLVAGSWLDLMVNGQPNPEVPVDFDRVLTGKEADSLFE